MNAELKLEKIFKWYLFQTKWPDLKIISQNYFSHDPLPKLLKWFRSAEQNGRQS